MNNKKYILAFAIVLLVGVFAFYIFSSPCEGSDCKVNENGDTTYSTYPELNPATLPSKVSNGEVFLVDVREVSEWNEGHIEGASLIPLSNINQKSIEGLPKDKPLYIYCRSGRRAGEAEEMFKSLGFETAKNIGGISDWVDRGGVLVK